jgi:sterol desaturase/sphingolipid hydroxylase (fatty acid hydroxylase superfamily)
MPSKLIEELLFTLNALPQKLLYLTEALCVYGLIFIMLERVFYIRKQAVFRPNWFVDLALCYIGIVIPPILLVFTGYGLAKLLQPVTQMVSNQSWVDRQPIWLYIGFMLLLTETFYYWAHRLAHEIPFLWRWHSIHHQAEQLDWLVNPRAHPFDLAWSRSLSLIPAIVFSPGHIAHNPVVLQYAALFTLFNTAWAYFIHANLRLRLGWLEKIITTPAFHHWHHTNDDSAHINKNYAALLPICDMVFGSYFLPKNQLPGSYGLFMRK